MIPPRIAACLALGLTLMVAGPLPAGATAFCLVKATSDGFVALREGPGAQSRLLVRMRAGEEVLLREARRGAWLAVRWWPEGVRVTPEGFARGGRDGWVHGGLVEDCG